MLRKVHVSREGRIFCHEVFFGMYSPVEWRCTIKSGLTEPYILTALSLLVQAERGPGEYIRLRSLLQVFLILLPSGSEQHEVLLFESIQEGILQAHH